jgi:hypothetical protein
MGGWDKILWWLDDDNALDTDDFAVCAPERRGKKSVIRQQHTWRSY